MLLVRRTSLYLTVVLAALLGAAAGCRTSDKGVRPMVRDGGSDAPITDGGFFEMAPAQCTTVPADKKSDGSDCSCGGECGSGFCVHGVCCNSACNGTCMACNVPSAKGTCSPVPDGETPRMGGQCQAEPSSSCGLDGTCNGAGACRKFVDGTVCAPGTCQGSSVVGAKVCSEGSCVPGPTTICSPFACDAVNGRCQARCTDDSQCDGRACEQGSCGKKPLGAVCTGGEECDSGSCADGVCCNVSCTGACVSCNQVAKMGECSPVAAGARDPHNKCTEEARSTCGLSGLCNGLGGCAKHAAGTECLPPSCSSGSEIPMSICDGNGTCLVGAPVPCAPFVCSGTSCKLSCIQADDCTAGNPCVGGSCGKIPMGGRCTTAGECATGFCVDGFCCNSACSGTCENCALPTARGRCTAVGAGAVDPRNVCKDNGSTACGTNGRCNGNRGCQTYPAGTPCRASSCNTTTHNYTQDGTCRNGACSVPAATNCAPFKCNGGNCGRTCGSNNDCQAPATCVNGSCGLKPLGSPCSRGAECVAPGQCAQGVCCNSACAGSCFSCNQTGMAGTCTAVPANGPDPAGVCTNQGQASCGNDGTCNGLGGCKKFAPGAICLAASCSAGVARAASTCNGSGTCVAGSTRMCTPFVCNTAGSDCTSSCTNDMQCAPPNSCVGSLCGKKGLGSPCNAGSECVAPGQCVEGFCCNTACTESCRSCALAASRGTCSPVPASMADPKSMCPAGAPGTCGNDGFCNGSGACSQRQGTSCGSVTCSGSTETATGTCNGSGTCTPGASNACPGSRKCNAEGTGCLGTCGSSNDCVTGTVCVSGSCVAPKAIGQTCGAGSECMSGNCVDGVCCNEACGGACRNCATGTCANVTSGNEPLCTGGSGCELRTGNCAAGGVCEQTNNACPSVCTGNSVQTKQCNGMGSCENTATPPTPCAPPNEICGGAGVCGPCTMDAQCGAGKVCTSGVCMDAPVPDGGGP